MGSQESPLVRYFESFCGNFRAGDPLGGVESVVSPLCLCTVVKVACGSELLPRRVYQCFRNIFCPRKCFEVVVP